MVLGHHANDDPAKPEASASLPTKDEAITPTMSMGCPTSMIRCVLMARCHQQGGPLNNQMPNGPGRA
jgi:hypothetical protein